MFLEIFKFELQYRLKSADTYVFFSFLLLFSLISVEIVFEGVDLGLVKKNAPIVIAKTAGAVCGLSILIVSMVMGVPVLRDIQTGVTPLIYINPISKSAYLGGKFLGSLTVLLFIFSAVLFGMMLGEFMPWTDPEEYLPFRVSSYLQIFIWVVLPIILFSASLFFVTGILFKNLLVVYTQGLLVFVIFLLTKAIDHEFLQALLDPFSLSTLTLVNTDWTVEQNNNSLLPWNGILCWKNVLWLTIGIAALIYGYYKFQLVTTVVKTSKKKVSPTSKGRLPKVSFSAQHIQPRFSLRAQLLQLWACTWFEVRYILKQVLFWAIVISGFMIIMINSINLGNVHHINSYPTTYLIIEELMEMSIYFFVFILLIYSGEINSREKEVQLEAITDSTPTNSLIHLGSKLLGLLIIYSLLLLSLLLAGVLFQSSMAYFQFDWEVYFIGFFLELLPFLALYTMVAFFFQALIGHKFSGMIATLVFFIVNVLFAVLITDHVLVNFGGHTLPAYSDMNGYGHFLPPFLWAKVYWLVFGLILFFIASIIKQRGISTHLAKRWQSGWLQSKQYGTQFIIPCILLFVGSGSFIFYNTNILNEYWTVSDKETYRAQYEKSLKTYEYLPQPKLVSVQLNIELYPSERAYKIQGNYQLINPCPEPINEIHLQKQIATQVHWKEVQFDRSATLNNQYDTFHYYIYHLDQALLQGDTIQLNFVQTLAPSGFEANSFDTDILYNGSFIDNSILPTIGYQRKYELEDEVVRDAHDLAARNNKAAIDDSSELSNAQSGGDSDGINLEMIVGTASPQTAVSSGNLIAKWSANGRNYFHYKTDQKIINFYAVVSADYSIQTEKHQVSGDVIDLEIYHHQTHGYNIDRMMAAMKHSLDYFSTQFGPYPFQQIRIMEIPRYHQFAQSFPGAIPFSEALGFVMDINDEEDVDMVYFITAHELAHQWWGCQLEAANVQGKHFILETLAQYSAIMVLKEKYPKEKVQQFLQQQYDDYIKGVRSQKKEELPLMLVEDEEHIYYAKGVLSMYALQQDIGENQVNAALRHFLQDWGNNYQSDCHNRYATSKDLISYFREVTPPHLQDRISELFEETGVMEPECLIEAEKR